MQHITLTLYPNRLFECVKLCRDALIPICSTSAGNHTTALHVEPRPTNVQEERNFFLTGGSSGLENLLESILILP